LKTVYHPQFGKGEVLSIHMGGLQWEVHFESGRRFRLPAREFNPEARQELTPKPSRLKTHTRTLGTEQFRARQTLEALRLGIVPVDDAETFTIGLEAEKVMLDRALSRSREQGGDVLAVIGDYGYGKSHFIEIATQRALRENFLVARASLDLQEVPPSKAHKIYEALVTSITYPDNNKRGIAPLLEKALSSPGALNAFIAQCPIEPKSCPLIGALWALQDCPSQTASDEIVAWLSGQSKAQTEMKTCFKKPPRLYIAGENTRQYTYLLTALSVLAQALGYSGLAVFIDESEHYSLLTTAQRQRADSFFKASIVSALGLANGRIDGREIPEHPRVTYPITYASDTHLFFLFALTESNDRMPIGTWLTPVQLVRLDSRFIEKDILEFVKTLLRYHALAYHYSPSRERYELVISQIPNFLSRALSQHRINLRELIRVAVTIFDMLYWYPDYDIEQLQNELKKGLKA
jgi:hypothetical protein